MKLFIIMTIILLFTSFAEIGKFYKTLNEFKNHKTNTDETQQHKNKVINNAVTL